VCAMLWRVTGTYQVAGESAMRTFSSRAAIDAQVSVAIYEMGIGIADFHCLPGRPAIAGNSEFG
jgi:hypothetical protein